jgi:hypothetical protein
MAYVYEIIKDAFREANLIAITQNPTLDEQTEALRLFNRFVKSIFGNEAGDKLQSRLVGTGNVVTTTALPTYTYTSPNYIPLNSRLVCNLTTPTSLNLHPDPEDGSRIGVVDASSNFSTNNLTLVGNGRTLDGSVTTVLNTNGIQKEWFYRADLGNWLTISSLQLNDTFPFPLDFEDMFVIGLSMRLNPRNGAAMDEQTVAAYKRARSLFRARYTQSIQQASEDGLVRLSGTRLNRTSADLNENGH